QIVAHNCSALSFVFGARTMPPDRGFGGPQSSARRLPCNRDPFQSSFSAPHSTPAARTPPQPPTTTCSWLRQHRDRDSNLSFLISTSLLAVTCKLATSSPYQERLVMRCGSIISPECRTRDRIIWTSIARRRSPASTARPATWL